MESNNNPRGFGKTHEMIKFMAEKLRKGESVAVAGCKDPSDITIRLLKEGVRTTNEVMKVKKIISLPAFDGRFYMSEKTVEIETGYLFKLLEIKK